MSHGKQRPRVIRFLFDNSMFLIGGTIIALVWANVSIGPFNKDSYKAVVDFDMVLLIPGQLAFPKRQRP